MLESLRGQFLIAGKPLQDRNFFRSVVLMVEHNDQGAMGLIVNRPAADDLARLIREHFDLNEFEDVVFAGGPVEPNALFILHNASHLEGGESPVVPEVYVGSSPEILQTVIQEATEEDSDLRFRLVCGCAGWGPGQLESEIGRGDWLLTKACNETVFSSEPYQLWDQMLEQSRKEQGFLPYSPGNPEWN